MFDDGHFAEDFAGTELGKDPPGVGADQAGDFHQPVLDEINAVAGVAFAGKFPAGGEMPFLGDPAQGLQFVGVQIAEQRNGFECDHKRTL